MKGARQAFTLLAFFFVLGTAVPAPPAATGNRFLVLGFGSKQLNEIQDRLLRESIMRRLGMKGYRIVPVMEVESLLQGELKGRVRSLTRAEVRGICSDLDAGYACYGSIEPEGKMHDASIENGRHYRCSLALYRRNRDAFQEFIVAFTGRENLYDLYEELSETIASRIAEAP